MSASPAEVLSASASPGLVVSDLSKRYRGKLAVDQLSFRLPRGEVVALLGPNGAGKTTTMMCLAGLVRPDSGSIAWQDRELGPERGRWVALIPETPEIYGMLTVWEHLVFVAKSCRLPAGWEARGDGLLERLALAAERDTLAEGLSKGMRQKLLVASVVLAGAPVLLLDEPMIGLDPSAQRELRKIILELREQGTAVMVSTHLLSSVESYCDHLLILKQGRCLAAGTLAELLHERGKGSLEEAFLDIVG